MSSTAAGVVRAAATAAVVVAVDQIGKQIVVASISRGEVVELFPGLDLTNTRNPGVAFGALAGGGALVAVLIGVSLAVLIGYFASHVTMPWLWLPVGLLVGGALGNLIDRVREGSVVDYIDPVAWPAFNIADSCIVVGVIVLLFVVDRNQRHAAAVAAAAQEAAPDEANTPKP